MSNSVDTEKLVLATGHKRKPSRQASIKVVYEVQGRAFELRIERYQSTDEADRGWSNAKDGEAISLASVEGMDVAYTVKGGTIRAAGVDVFTMDQVQCKAGKYRIWVSPAAPKKDDPGFRLVWEQAKKITTHSEPVAGPNSR